MKKLLITAAAVLASLNLFAQGTVNFGNNTGSRVFVDSVGGTAAGLPTYAVGLYYAPDGVTDESMFTFLGPRASVFTGGIISGGTRTAPTAAPGGFGMFQVRGWTTAYGTDYQSGLDAGDQGGANKVGKSNIVRVDTGDPTVTPPGTPGALATSGLLSFAVTTVPEPSAIALGLIGAGALLLLRRRK